ncbi:MAG: Na(+)/H(+) antiporter subunit B [Pseudomonadota bacterium]
MNVLIWALDVTLAFALVAVAARTLATADLFETVALFIAYGLLVTLAWVRLEAVDVALAEAGIGTGFTGALLLAGLGRLQRQEQRRDDGNAGPPP